MLTAADEFILLQVQSSNQFIAGHGAERGMIRYMKYAELAPDTGSDEKRRNLLGLGLLLSITTVSLSGSVQQSKCG